MDLSFRARQFGALQLISGELDERADPELLKRCGDFFMENGQYDKAVDLLAIGKKVRNPSSFLKIYLIIACPHNLDNNSYTHVYCINIFLSKIKIL